MPGVGANEVEPVPMGVQPGQQFQVQAPGGQLLGWSRALAQRGFATISISLKGSVVRRGTAAAWEGEAKLLEAYGRPHMGIVADIINNKCHN